MQNKFRFTHACKVAITLLLFVVITFSIFGTLDLRVVRAYEGTTTDQPTESLYAWSPVSNMLLYWSLNSKSGGPGLQPYDLNLYNAQNEQQYILASGGYVGIAKFSKDGSTISFWYDSVPYIVDLADNEISSNRVRTDDDPIKGAFSSNNDLLIYTTASDEIRLRNLTTNIEISLGVFESISTLPNLFPTWSPDDQWVAFGSEANSILIDPFGINDTVILDGLTLPQSEFSPAFNYFKWSSGSRSLYDYSGKLVHSFISQAEPPSIFGPENLSFDNTFEILYSDSELFLRHVASGTEKQLTFNKNTIEQMLELPMQSQSLPQSKLDVPAQAVADGFDFPVGKPNMSGYNTTAGCWWLQNDAACPGPHPGQDINGNGGGDSDLNDPVYAVANGTVVFSGVGSGTSWGNIIMIEHTLPDGSKVWSQYAHLQSRNVTSGTVNKGDQIGTIGKGYNNIYYAHLHFEIRIQYRAADAWISGWSVSQVEQYYVKPTDYINSHRTIGGGNSCPSVSGEVRLYDLTNCSGDSTVAGGTGLWSMASSFNDKAESIAIPGGWSARLYQNDNENISESACFSSTDSNLNDNTFANGGQVGGNATWMRVYDNSSCTGGSPPNIPSNLRINSSTPTSITIAWDDVSNESGYRIYEWNGSSFVYLATVGANVTSYTETRSSCGWDEFYTVSAYNNYGESDQSGWVQGYTQSCIVNPDAPSLVSPGNNATVGRYDSVTLDWNTANGATQYYAEFWGGPNFNLNSGWTTSTDYFVGSSFWGGTYQWRVKSRNSSNVESGWSETRTLYRKYGPPSSLTYSGVTQTQATLAWGASADAPGNISGYRIYRNGTAITTVGSSTLNYTDTGLSCAASYSYIVKAYKDNFESDASNTVNVTTQTCSPSGTDSYEPDDTFGQAKVINSGSSQIHSIVPATDVDWVKFTLNASSAVTLETTGTSSSDTRMWLYDASVNQVDYSDDEGVGNYSFLDRQCGVDALPAGTYYVKIDEYSNNDEIPNYQISLNATSCMPANAGTWYIYGVGSYIFGESDDIPVPADYNGDGKDDIAIFRPSTSTWYIYEVGPFTYGTVGDIPVVADYNGDGKDDIAVFRPTNSTWYIYGVGPRVYGTVGDIPVVADYNGDGKDDIAVFRPTNSTWYIYGVGPFVYGTVGDIPVVADYNGDGKADIAVFRPSNSTWYIYGVGPSVYGVAGDTPVVADYNGDGKADIAVFRPSDSTWYIRGVGPSVYGVAGDTPVVADYNGDGKADIAVFRP